MPSLLICAGRVVDPRADRAPPATAGAVAFSDDGKPVRNTLVMPSALRARAELKSPIRVHEEDPRIVRGGGASAGPIARSLGPPEWPSSAEADLTARDI